MIDVGILTKKKEEITASAWARCESLTNISIGVVCVGFSGRLSWDRWRQQTDTRSTTLISQSCSSGKSIGTLSAALTCCSRWGGCGGRGWGEGCGRLLVLLFALLVTLGLFGGAGVFWFFLLLVLLFLFFLIGCSPHPAPQL